MQKNLEDFDGSAAVFIDANIFLHHAFNTNANCIEFLRSIELFNYKVYTSALVLEEIYFKLLMQSASNFMSKVTLHHLKSLLTNEKQRKQVFAPVMEYVKYIDILEDYGLKIAELQDIDMGKAVQKAGVYGLITADAAHLAVMERKGITNIATCDNDFKIVAGITVWMPGNA